MPGWSWAHARAEQNEAFWENGFANLKRFLEQHDHSEIPIKYKADDGFQLGKWVLRVRQNTVEPDRRRRLEALPRWSWSRAGRSETVWEKHFADLKQYSEREGHSIVPFYYRTQGGFWLGQWVSAQRVKFNKDKLAPDRQRRLEALPGWVWRN